MWPRIGELLLAAWLMLTPVVFAGTESLEAFVARDIVAGAAVALLALLSFWRRMEWPHLVTAAIALVLGLVAYAGWPRPGPPAAQNEITVALCLVLLAIIPNEASRPPRPWRTGPDDTARGGVRGA